MKKNLIRIFIIGILLTILSCQSQNENPINETATTPNVGTIGDVIYSVLSPTDFTSTHGLGWVLMDDKVNLSNSQLLIKFKIKSIPDARGLFIRALNLGRSNADPYVNRGMGSFQ